MSRKPERWSRAHPARGLGTRFASISVRYLTDDRPYLTLTRTDPEPNPAVLDLVPLPGTPEVERHEVDRSRLLDGARSAYRTTHLVLEGEDVQVVPRPVAYRDKSTRATRHTP